MLSCRKYARLLWKTSNGHTAFVDGVSITKDSSTYSTTNHFNNNDFKGMLDNFYFCRYASDNNTDWYKLKISNISEYREEKVFGNITITGYNKNEIDNNPENSRLKFKLYKKEGLTKEIFLCDIKSSEAFYDYVNNFEPKNLIKEEDNIY